jgi:four helix bundle protein
MHNYNNLHIWQQAMDLVVDIYKLTSAFPIEEKYGLASQMNRAAVSIPSNIAEGAGRNSDKDFSHFISMSIGSMNELQTQLILSERLGLVDSDRSREIQATLDNLQRMAIAFKTKLDNI